MKRVVLGMLFGAVVATTVVCDDESTDPEPVAEPTPKCERTDSTRADLRLPESAVADWGAPVRLGAPVNTLCPQDAIEITGDGGYLYVMYTEDVLGEMTPEQILARYNNTYRCERIGGPGEFGEPEFFELGKGIAQSFNGELSFSPDGALVYFHSLRSTNLGYLEDPPTDDFLDVYVADFANGEAGAGRNLGEEVNSVYPDGEEGIHPDGVTLYFGSHRPGGSGGADIWVSSYDGEHWSAPENLGTTINSGFNDYQPTFTADGDTMYFASARNPLVGMAIYRSVRTGGEWGAPELVIRGLAGEPSLTADGQLLYFVHVVEDEAGAYDSDVWYCARAAR